jgi:hypothetical protein
LSLYQLYLVNPVQLETRIIRTQGPWSYPGSNWARNHFLLLLLRLVLHILLILLVLLLVRLLISRPRKGGISIILPMYRLPTSLLLHHIPGALLLTPGGTVTSAATG